MRLWQREKPFSNLLENLSQGTRYCPFLFKQLSFDRFNINSTFQKFANVIYNDKETYDLIVSNPPFYTDDFESQNSSRNTARFTSSLSFNELLIGVSKILSKTGYFSTIIPYKEEANFINLAKKYNLFLNKICRVQGNNVSEIKRSLLTFSFFKKEINKSHLIIEKSRHQYTDEYVKLTNSFYLKMQLNN